MSAVANPRQAAFGAGASTLGVLALVDPAWMNYGMAFGVIVYLLAEIAGIFRRGPGNDTTTDWVREFARSGGLQRATVFGGLTALWGLLELHFLTSWPA